MLICLYRDFIEVYNVLLLLLVLLMKGKIIYTYQEKYKLSFRTVYYGMYNKKDTHVEIVKLETVTKIVYQLLFYKDCDVDLVYGEVISSVVE